VTDTGVPDRAATPVRVLAPAKINLALAVLDRRSDGFHELASIFLRIGLADELTIRHRADGGHGTAAPEARAESPAGDRLTVRGDADCPAPDNLVLRAASLLREGADGLPGLDLELHKRIPVAAGLGGGSSDAAAALRGCASAWDLRLDPRTSGGLAVRLGSDVPFFAAGVAAALVTGRGEGIEPLPGPSGSLSVLLVVAGQKPSTAAVFDEHRRRPGPTRQARTASEGLARGLADALRAGLSGPELAARADQLHDANDLWPAAARLLPALVPLRQALERSLGRPVLLSGAGPGLVALYPSQDEAAQAAERLAASRLPAESPTIIATDLATPTATWRTP
jgi:4-diphosphocytidyl-2-C-methyl-D-erythritol kinase